MSELKAISFIMAKEIPLTQGYVAVVDDEDFAVLSEYSWVYDGRYAAARVSGKKTRMHRFLMQLPAGVEVDHINGDRLDNRRSNLRPATRQQNAANTRKKGNGKYKGVKPHKGKYVASIMYNYRSIHIGCYGTPEEAARAYDEKARELFGEYARGNI